MQKILATAMAAIVILTFTWEVPTTAQTSTGGGDSLRASTKTVRDAMLKGTPEGLFGTLAPWMQGRAKLFRAKIHGMIDDEVSGNEEAEREVLSEISEKDPDNVLGVETIEDVKALTAAQLLAFDTEILLWQATDNLDERRNAEWFEVDCAIYAAQDELMWRNGDAEVVRTFGEVAYMNEFEDIITVTCVAEGDTWQVVNFGAMMDGWDTELSNSAFARNPMRKVVEQDERDERRAEAELMLGSMKSQARVQYSKTAVTPETLEASGVTESERLGYFFTIRDRVYKKPDALRGGLVAEPFIEEDGWCALFFNYENGEGDFKWYETEDELEEALKWFETAK